MEDSRIFDKQAEIYDYENRHLIEHFTDITKAETPHPNNRASVGLHRIPYKHLEQYRRTPEAFYMDLRDNVQHKYYRITDLEDNHPKTKLIRPDYPPTTFEQDIASMVSKQLPDEFREMMRDPNIFCTVEEGGRDASGDYVFKYTLRPATYTPRPKKDLT